MSISSSETGHAQYIAPSEYDLRDARYFAAQVLPEEDEAFSIAGEVGQNQTLLAFAGTARVVEERLQQYPTTQMLLVMTRATAHEAAHILQGRPDVHVEIVSV